MDIATLVGLALAFAAILGGQALEGGHIGSILQPTAALIVFGGTIGAVSLQFPSATLRKTLRSLSEVFKPSRYDLGETVRTVVTLANKARREGLVSIEKEAEEIKDPFLKRAVEMAVDGTEAKVLRSALEMELEHHEEEGEGPIKVLESGGGYAPTVGILGAVLGLIHVMENLADPSKLGGGIAVAFVATVYGVGLANLILLPMSGKLKTRHREHTLAMEVTMEGVCAIAEGENPRIIERKLSIYIGERKSGAPPKEAVQKAELKAAA